MFTFRDHPEAPYENHPAERMIRPAVIVRKNSQSNRSDKGAKFTFHDLRRSCLTNMARHLPVHVVQEIAGHSDIKTTQQFYLAVQEDDLEKVRKVQSGMLAERPTDQLLTNPGPIGVFPRLARRREAS